MPMQGSKCLSCGQLVHEINIPLYVPQSNGLSPHTFFPHAGGIVHPALWKFKSYRVSGSQDYCSLMTREL